MSAESVDWLNEHLVFLFLLVSSLDYLFTYLCLLPYVVGVALLRERHPWFGLTPLVGCRISAIVYACEPPFADLFSPLLVVDFSLELFSYRRWIKSWAKRALIKGELCKINVHSLRLTNSQVWLLLVHGHMVWSQVNFKFADLADCYRRLLKIQVL